MFSVQADPADTWDVILGEVRAALAARGHTAFNIRSIHRVSTFMADSRRGVVKYFLVLNPADGIFDAPSCGLQKITSVHSEISDGKFIEVKDLPQSLAV